MLANNPGVAILYEPLNPIGLERSNLMPIRRYLQSPQSITIPRNQLFLSGIVAQFISHIDTYIIPQHIPKYKSKGSKTMRGKEYR